MKPSIPARLMRALMVGVATLFAMKPDPRMHWSIPPTAAMQCPGHQDHAADPRLP